MSRVAAFGWRLSAFGVNALNRGYVRKLTLAIVADYFYEQPGNRIGIERIHLRGGFAGDGAAIFQFPRWAGGMLSDHFVMAIAQLRVGTFQRPTETITGCSLAGVDLRAGGVSI